GARAELCAAAAGAEWSGTGCVAACVKAMNLDRFALPDWRGPGRPPRKTPAAAGVFPCAAGRDLPLQRVDVAQRAQQAAGALVGTRLRRTIAVARGPAQPRRLLAGEARSLVLAVQRLRHRRRPALVR